MNGPAQIKFENEKAVLRTMKKFPRAMNRGIKKVFQKQGSEIQRREIRVTTRRLKRRTGTLARGWTFRVVGNLPVGLELIIINETVYGPIHEYGGTITPKTKKFLAIPLDAAKTSVGVAKVSPGDLPYKQTFVAAPRGTPIIFFKKSKSDTKPTPMFVLKKSVTIPARLSATGVFLAQRFKFARAIETEVTQIWAKGK